MFIYASKADKNREEKEEGGIKKMRRIWRKRDKMTAKIVRKGDKKEKGKKAKMSHCLTTKAEPSKKFLYTNCKNSSKASDAQNNLNRGGGNGDRHYLRCVNLLQRIHAKARDIFARFNFERVPGAIREGGSNYDW